MENNISLSRSTGIVSILGAISMIIGAVFYFSTEADLWEALANNDMAAYLAVIG